MLYQEENPGVEFEYSLPSGSIKETPQGGEGYIWTTGPWAECTSSCGGGQKTRSIMCTLEVSKEVVAEGLCDANIKPPESEPCNDEACEVRIIYLKAHPKQNVNFIITYINSFSNFVLSLLLCATRSEEHYNL